MAHIFGALDISTRGLLVTKRALNVTAHNIANANTPGYSRQRQVVEASAPITAANGHIGTGVRQQTIQRITDEFIERQLILERSSLGSLDAQGRALAQIDAVLNEQQNEGLTGSLSEFYRSLSDLASATDSGARTERASVIATANALVTTIHRADSRLRDLQRATDRTVVGLLPEINQLAARIAELNVEIVRESAVAPANDLLDQRDQLVRELSEKIEVSTFEVRDGSLVVMIASGIPLVDGARSATLEERPDTSNPFDPTYSRIFFTDGANDLEVTGDIGGGELGGLLRARDTIVADAIRGLDTVAYNLANTINEQHRQGYGLGDAVGGRDFFAQPATIEDAARTLALDAAVAGAGGADRIAAAGNPGGAPNDNENALLLAGLEHKTADAYAIGDALPAPPLPGAPSVRKITVIDLAASMLSGIGQEARSVEQSRSQQVLIVESLENRRDEVSGVSIDEEVSDLVRLQAAFQANARVVAAVNQLLEGLVSIL
jgi:flagellar hook-associated protein 1 FlgK